jgi:hypothetical protein
VCPNYLVTFVASSLTIGFDAFIVDLMSQSRDFAPMGDDEAAKGAGGDGEVEFSLHQASKPLDSNGQFALRRIVRTEIGCRPPLREKGPNGVVPGPPRARLAPSMSSQRRVNLPPPARSGCARRRRM